MKPREKCKTEATTVHFTHAERSFLDVKARETGQSLTDVIRTELGLTKLADAYFAMKKSARKHPVTNAYSAQ